MALGTRRKGREYALQILYQIEAAFDLESNILFDKKLFDQLNNEVDTFFNHFEASQSIKNHTHNLVVGVVKNIKQLDKAIQNTSKKWRLSRMAKVDRNLLRMACYEMFFCLDIPKKVIINEAIEISKKYGSEHSSAFINGILDQIASVKE
jgi:transcription antitermination factor NusB